jgi:integrase
VDLKNRTVRITTQKGGKPRILLISAKLTAMLENMSRISERVFPCSQAKEMAINFHKQRKRLVRKLGNPRLLEITFHTLRHWRATMEFHRTKDILHVMKFLGHRNIGSTLIYIGLEKATFGSPKDDEFTVRVAKTLDEP